MERYLENVEPKEVFYFFEEISKIPRESGNEQEISDYLVSFGKARGFEVVQDKKLNVLIKKPGTKGRENEPALILQSHMDMVCQKNEGVQHDFTKDPIKMTLEGNKLIAKETTLGADDGIGVSMALAVLDSTELSHPPIEAIFTTNEETDLTGAEEFDASQLSGKYLINLDSDDEGIFIVGSAGGPSMDLILPLVYEEVKPDSNLIEYTVEVKGLLGGHSGEDIHRIRANSNKLMVRIFAAMERAGKVELIKINGGTQNNAIPREGTMGIAISEGEESKINEAFEKIAENLKKEYEKTDPDISIKLIRGKKYCGKIFSQDTKFKTISFGWLCDTGIIRMSPYFEGTVESSNSLGVIETRENDVRFRFTTRSMMESLYMDMVWRLERFAELLGARLEKDCDCLEWDYNPDSKLQELCRKLYVDKYGKEPKMLCLHAGLECGIIGKNMNKPVDMISMGPDIRNLHAPGEYVDVDTMKEVWEFFKHLLAEIK